MTLRMGLHMPVSGFTEQSKETAANLQAEVLCWLALAMKDGGTAPHRPEDARAFPDGTHILRIPNPAPAEQPADWMARIVPLLDVWTSSGIPPGALIVQSGNEPDWPGVDLPVAWGVDAWLGAAHGYRDALKARYGNLPLLAPPFTCKNTNALTFDYVQPYEGVAVHAYWSKGNPGWRQGKDGGQAWTCALFGKPIYVTELGSNPQDAGEIVAWAKEVDSPLVFAATIFIADSAQSWPEYTVTPQLAAAIRAGLSEQPPPPPPPPQGYTRDSEPMHTGAAYQSDAWLVALRGRNPNEADRIVATYGTCAAALGYDGNLMIAQGWVETAGFTSSRWRNAHNAAGIGIYSDGTPDVQFGSVERGIQAQAGLLSDYFGDGRDPWGVLAEYGLGFDTPLGKVRLRDLDGVWAADTGYSAAIVAVANSVTGGVAPVNPMPPTGIPLSAVADMLLTQLGNLRSGTFDTHNGDHPWWLYCQAAVESTLRQLGVPLGPFISAAACAAAMEAAGLIHHDTNYPYGAVLVWGEAFYKDGHTAIGLDHFAGTFVGTTDQGIQIRAGWQDQPGYIGWYVPPGVAEMEDDLFTVDGLIDDGRLDAAWFGTDAPTKTARANMPRVKGHGIPDRWEREFRAGRNLGPVRTKEKKADNTGAIIQYFTSGWIVWYPDGSTSVN